MNDLVMPVIERIPPPLWCAVCHATGPRVRIATHSVDGTSVCATHLRAAIAQARERRQA